MLANRDLIRDIEALLLLRHLEAFIPSLRVEQAKLRAKGYTGREVADPTPIELELAAHTNREQNQFFHV